MKKTLLFLTLMLFIFTSCDKNQQAVKLLNGTWTLVSVTIRDTETGNEEKVAQDEDDATLELEFDNCKLKVNEYCTVTNIITFDNESEYEINVYQMSGDGTQMELGSSKYDDEPSTIEIVTLDETSLVTKMTDEDEENIEYEFTYEK